MLTGYCLSVLVLSTCLNALYIPGLSPTEYVASQRVPVLVNSLAPTISPSDQKLHSIVNFDYYLPPLHFCRPEEIVAQSESLGSVLFGDRIYNTPLEFKMLENETCTSLCKTTIPQNDAFFVSHLITQDYVIKYLVDGLPAGSAMIDTATNEGFDVPGFPLGSYDESTEEVVNRDKVVYNNYYEFLIDYHKLDDDDYRIVGVEVYAASSATSDCKFDNPYILSTEKDNDIEIRYSVRWQESDVRWATRWDKLLYISSSKIHWFSLAESTLIVIFLTAMVAFVLIRTLKKDISRYNEISDEEELSEDSGWKLVHGDVFRTPTAPMLLAVVVGSGIQLFCMIGTTILFALLGFLSPSNRGSLATAVVLFYAVYGFLGGFSSAVMYKFLGCTTGFKTLLFLTPTFLPLIVFGTLLLLNFFLVAKGASGAVPFGTLLAIIAIFGLISLPLSVIGGFIGLKPRFSLVAPVKTNQIPRQIPPQSLYLRSLPAILLSGTLPFGAIFVELYFILGSLWGGRFYYMFGFLFLSYGILIVTSTMVSILMVYFQLCSENYQWQWRSFLTGGSIGLYVFLNSVIYYFTKLKLEGVTAHVLYYGYSALISLLVSILGGTVGFIGSGWFVRKVYSSIKVD